MNLMLEGVQDLLSTPWPAGLATMAIVYWHNFSQEATFYVLSAGIFWGLLHLLLKRRLAHRLIDRWPTVRDLRREIGYSISTLLVFGSLGVVTVGLLFSGHVTIYQRANAHGWLWWVLSGPALVIWHDFYFYVTHRLLHTRWLFRHVHGVHHRSRQPSPWAAYAFHPVEALINGLVTLLALLVVPVHIGVLIAFSLHQIIRNTHGHLAVETLPAGFTRHALGRLFTTTTHHHLHHETAQGNYGLWFTGWDRVFGTERADYLERFDEVTRRERPLPAARHTDNHAYAPADH